MTEPRKPIFGFLWPRPDPDAPLDAAYRQVRRVRITPRGPIRLATLLVGSTLTAMAAASTIMAALTTVVSATTVLSGAIVATAIVLILRGWVVGTYVNDMGVTIETTWRHRTIPWAEVRTIETVTDRAPFLGLPARLTAERSVVQTTDGAKVATHVYSCSPDLWLRAEAFDMARLRLERWQGER